MNTILLPALRGQIGDWIYYVTLMKLKDISQRITFAEEIYNSTRLRELIQRDVLPTRAKEIGSYLLTQNQRFFNSVTVGVYGGEPQWIEMSSPEKIGDINIELSNQGILGYLKFSGEEVLFAIDGQHRIAGIQNALNSRNVNESFKNEEISVIFIGHKRTEEGRARTRRLFTTLNRYAKPVSLKDIIALDEDDIAAILTRELIEKHKLFNNEKISLSTGHSLNPKDKKSFTNIATLYKCNQFILKAKFKLSDNEWNKYRKNRPDESVVIENYDFLKSIWDNLVLSFPILSEYLAWSERNFEGSFPLRIKEGGLSIYRPIGLQTIIKVLSFFIQKDYELEQVFRNISNIDLSLNAVPWKNVIWEPDRQRMIVRDINQKTIYRLILYMLGVDLVQVKYSASQLKMDYASLLNTDNESISLPEKIINNG